MRISSLQKNCQTLEKVSHSHVIVVWRALCDRVSYALKLSRGFGVPTTESLDRERTKDDILGTAVVAMLLMLPVEASVKGEGTVFGALFNVRWKNIIHLQVLLNV